MPTTLPTLDEVLGVDGVDESNVAGMLKHTANNPRDQVFTLHAELEGQKLAPVFEQLLDGWRAQGYTACDDGRLSCDAGPLTLPSYPVTWGEVPGPLGELIVQPD